jgi:hypothetical protein
VQLGLAQLMGGGADPLGLVQGGDRLRVAVRAEPGTMPKLLRCPVAMIR